jgi:hypothetical protein
MTRRLDREVVKPRPEKPRRGALQPSIFATSHSFDERDALIDNGELPSFTDLLSHAPPAQMAPQVVNLMMESDDVS